MISKLPARSLPLSPFAEFFAVRDELTLPLSANFKSSTALDLADYINGFQILQLTNENTSSGLGEVAFTNDCVSLRAHPKYPVNKIIIAERHLGRFINSISPGTYTSLTNVNLRVLDQFKIKPVGVYGTRKELVQFLLRIGGVSEDVAEHILMPRTSDHAVDVPILHSGLYLFSSSASSPPNDDEEPANNQHFLVYWPEDTTWSDSAEPHVVKNRTTFMRYLTKLCDQLLVFIDDDSVDKLISESSHDKSDSDTNEDSGTERSSDGEERDDEAKSRMFEFNVAKMDDQKESVTPYPGFKVSLAHYGLFIPTITWNQFAHHEITQDTKGTMPDGTQVPQPRLITSETHQGYIIPHYVAETRRTEPFNQTWNRMAILNAFQNFSIRVDPTLPEAEIHAFSEVYVRSTLPTEYSEWDRELQEIEREISHERDEKEAAQKVEQEANLQKLELAVECWIIERIGQSNLSALTQLDIKSTSWEGLDESERRHHLDYTSALLDTYHQIDIEGRIWSLAQKKLSHPLSNRGSYHRLKERFLVVDYLFRNCSAPDASPNADWEHDDKVKLSTAICSDDDLSLELPEWMVVPSDKESWLSKIFGKLRLTIQEPQDIIQIASAECHKENIKDIEFLQQIHTMTYHQETLAEPAVKVLAEMSKELRTIFRDLVIETTELLTELMANTFKEVLTSQLAQKKQERRLAVNKTLIEKVNRQIAGGRPELRILGFRPQHNHQRSIPASHGTFVISAREEIHQPAMITYHVRLLGLLSEDRRRILSEDGYKFQPQVDFLQQKPWSFSLPVGYVIKHFQIFSNTNCLAVIDDNSDTFKVYLSSLSALDAAVSHAKGHRLALRVDKVGKEPVIAVDEVRNLFASVVYDLTKVICQLHVWQISDDFQTGFEPTGSITLTPWQAEPLHVVQACFVSGADEIVLVEASACVRIYSLARRQYRPAHVQLVNVPRRIFSSSDGSCIFALDSEDRVNRLLAYHSASFGLKPDCHKIPLPDDNHALTSTSLQITQESCSYQFTSRKLNSSLKAEQRAEHAAPHPLISCHEEMWTRFPVVAAVQRETLTQDGRSPSFIQFITPRENIDFGVHFKDMMRRCKKQTKKTFDTRLKTRKVLTVAPDDLRLPISSSTFIMGEWIVELLCLLPIQIALDARGRTWSDHANPEPWMVREPFPAILCRASCQSSVIDGSAKRGKVLYDVPFCRHLVSRIRNADDRRLLAFFNAHKRVSSGIFGFRGLGIRRALDSRRDIASAFHSFQSSASILEPTANPTLFQSALTIIVKDVADADSDEIVQEFGDKFQRIVMDEQESNFITRLHNGNINIIPWPLIETEKFYTIFKQISRNAENAHGKVEESLAVYRAQRLDGLLLSALALGVLDSETQEPLSDMDTGLVLEADGDIPQRLFILGFSYQQESEVLLERAKGPGPASVMSELRGAFASSKHRADPVWIDELSRFLSDIADRRLNHVRLWLETNSQRFSGHPEIKIVQRRFEQEQVELKASLQVCKLQCAECRLLCVEPLRHLGAHTCHTDHKCQFACDYLEDHDEDDVGCELPAGHEGRHICRTGHLCGLYCDHSDKVGCLGPCTKEVDHADAEHACSARYHQCGMPCDLRNILSREKTPYSCPQSCTQPFDVPHDNHSCAESSCPLQCELCKRLCNGSHLHGLSERQHLCGQDHPCSSLCSAPGVCEVETVPHSITATFSGKYDTFQFTKYSQSVKRLPCSLTIPAGSTQHHGPHRHSVEENVFHYCDARCAGCDYVCTLPYGHRQNEHETSHGSCTRTQWALEGDRDAMVEIGGHRYATSDSGSSMLCSMVCSAVGKRHAHIDFCRAEGGRCRAPGLDHIDTRMEPNANLMKDWITHKLHWERLGFKDPYGQRERAEFALCDAQCRDPQHEAHGNAAAEPSFCTLPMFHHPHRVVPNNFNGYVSTDGHLFNCNDPTSRYQSYHVIFVIDRSGSMASNDRWPLGGTPVTNRIVAASNNRLGAVFSALYSFWTARAAGYEYIRRLQGNRAFKDAYSLIFFDQQYQIVREHDSTSTPDQLLDMVLQQTAYYGTNFDLGIAAARYIMERHWSAERTPVIIFLSDGECGVTEHEFVDMAQCAVTLGKPLSFHAVSFGSDEQSYYLRRMATLAAEVYTEAQRDADAPPAREACTYTVAIDTISLAGTFLEFAESLHKPRAALLLRRR
ncbi:hypothetical protein SISSUDRAFT_314112 [Sistotremastrum suecicum HHB10207 ss-3]|uniref:VWFA domain-containing protein n=1 Tax=Sistotremastrum suecicum HHB10207 ss-3 TaxID=1314776 RepID=A0A165ZB97_9AGAM|nr:hypothetical protein SISSUDRAFT_314112 [Sistotremastrum suecicum HHB10207 ss-3]